MARDVRWTPDMHDLNLSRGWTGCDSAEGTFCSVTMNGNRAVTAQIN